MDELIGKKVEVAVCDGLGGIGKTIGTVKEIVEVEGMKLCYFEEYPRYCVNALLVRIIDERS